MQALASVARFSEQVGMTSCSCLADVSLGRCFDEFGAVTAKLMCLGSPVYMILLSLPHKIP
jgi:hypothetical protein